LVNREISLENILRERTFYTNVFEGKIPFPLDNFEQIEEASALVIRQTLSGPRTL